MGFVHRLQGFFIQGFSYYGYCTCGMVWSSGSAIKVSDAAIAHIKTYNS